MVISKQQGVVKPQRIIRIHLIRLSWDLKLTPNNFKTKSEIKTQQGPEFTLPKLNPIPENRTTQQDYTKTLERMTFKM